MDCPEEFGSTRELAHTPACHHTFRNVWGKQQLLAFKLQINCQVLQISRLDEAG